MSSLDVYCMLLAMAGLGLVYWGKRRGFVRLNQLGIERFPSYARKVISNLADSSIIVAGYGFFGGAVLVLLTEYASGYIVLALVLYIAFALDEEWHGRMR